MSYICLWDRASSKPTSSKKWCSLHVSLAKIGEPPSSSTLMNAWIHAPSILVVVEASYSTCFNSGSCTSYHSRCHDTSYFSDLLFSNIFYTNTFPLAPHLRIVVSMDGGSKLLMSFTLYDFYFHLPSARSSINVNSSYIFIFNNKFIHLDISSPNSYNSSRSLMHLL